MWRRSLMLSVILTVPACGQGGSGGDPSPQAAGDPEPFDDPGIETFPDKGRTVVPVGTDIEYTTDPPTSGASYPVAEPGGFYTKPVDPGFLVQSMATGGVIIYYDAAPISAPELDSLRMLAEEHPGDFSPVVVVPRPDPQYPIVLTAWTHRLRLSGFDLARINNFIALYLGKGPENS
jgi:hypothetical protein